MLEKNFVVKFDRDAHISRAAIGRARHCAKTSPNLSDCRRKTAAPSGDMARRIGKRKVRCSLITWVFWTHNSPPSYFISISITMQGAPKKKPSRRDSEEGAGDPDDAAVQGGG